MAAVNIIHFKFSYTKRTANMSGYEPSTNMQKLKLPHVFVILNFLEISACLRLYRRRHDWLSFLGLASGNWGNSCNGTRVT